MPVITIPLVGQLTARGFGKTINSTSKDQQYVNALFEVSENVQRSSKVVSVIKRCGSTTGDTIGSGVKALVSYSNYFSSLYTTSNALYKGTTNLGTLAGAVTGLTVADTVMNATDVICFAASSSGYYCFQDAVTTNFPTFTGDTHTNTVIDNIASTTGLYPGQLITGTGIQAATRIATITSATAITTTLATTATNAGVTITKEAVAKVIDADYPSAVTSVTANAGYMFSATSDGKIYNSDINQPWSVGANSYITADFSADQLTILTKFGETIIAFGLASRQYFNITGNTSGSVLSVNRAANMYDDSQYQFPVFKGHKGYVVGAYTDTGCGLFEMRSPYDFSNLSDGVTGAVLDNVGLLQIGTIRYEATKQLIACFGTSGTRFLVFDPMSRMWSIFDSGTRIISSFDGLFTKNGVNTSFVWQPASGGSEVYTDSGAAYTMTIQTEPFVLNNGRPFWIDAIELLADTQASGTTSVTTYADDYTTAKTLSPFDMTAANKIIRRCGYYKNHVAIKLEHSANTAWRGQALKIHWRPASL